MFSGYEHSSRVSLGGFKPRLYGFLAMSVSITLDKATSFGFSFFICEIRTIAPISCHH